MADFIHSLFGTHSYCPSDPNDVRSTFLFVEPSFWTGAGRICDLWGGFDLYSFSPTPDIADARALYADWRITGQDFRNVMVSEAQELGLSH